MNARPPRQYDLSWNRPHHFALVFLCLLAVTALALRWSARGDVVGVVLPVDPVRIEAARQRIDPNNATVASLRRLRGIGPAKADAIVAYRRKRGGQPFASAEDLQEVRGIGEGIARRVAPDLTFAPFGEPTTRP